MIILGIDPGTATTGYGVIEVQGSRFTALDYGCISTKPTFSMPERLDKIHQGLSLLIERFHPDEVAVEQLYFNTNATTAISVGQARGVILLAAAQKKLPVGEYTPLQVKQAMVGYGRAEKKQVQYMVASFLKLSNPPKPDDAADALAIAICHAHNQHTKKLRGEV